MVKTINLIDVEKSDVKYEVFLFNDGEAHIKLLGDLDRKSDYKVICRITNSDNLFVLMQVGNILNRQAVRWSLDIFYLMSMRMDRVINFNEAYSLEIVANVINSMKPTKVLVYHPHSNKTLELINNCYDMEEEYTNESFLQSINWTPGAVDIVCYPDAGANERYNKENKDNVIVLSKVRDLENKGSIKSIEIAHTPHLLTSEFVGRITVVDDLCDAGGTFVGAAKVLREKFPHARLCIEVRHLVNPVGLKNLSENYDMVYITDSYNDWSSLICQQFENVKVNHVTSNLER